jgi:hypothetical protein
MYLVSEFKRINVQSGSNVMPSRAGDTWAVARSLITNLKFYKTWDLFRFISSYLKAKQKDFLV